MFGGALSTGSLKCRVPGGVPSSTQVRPSASDSTPSAHHVSALRAGAVLLLEESGMLAPTGDYGVYLLHGSIFQQIQARYLPLGVLLQDGIAVGASAHLHSAGTPPDAPTPSAPVAAADGLNHAAGTYPVQARWAQGSWQAEWHCCKPWSLEQRHAAWPVAPRSVAGSNTAPRLSPFGNRGKYTPCYDFR
jgi:hypothetical protein